MNHIGRTYRRLGDIDKAVELLEKSLHIARETGDLQNEIRRLNALSFVYRTQGRLEEARRNHQKAFAMARRAGDHRQEAGSLIYLGVVALDLGEVEKAIEMLEEALFFSRESGDLRGNLVCLGLLSHAHFSLGHMKLAIELREQSLALARKIGDAWGESINLSWLARTLIATGEFSKAYEFGLQALELKMPDTNYPPSLVLGFVMLHRHDPSATNYFKDTVARCQSTLKKTGQFYEIRYILGTALVGKAVCGPHWNKVHKQKEPLAPALVEYQYALDICDARGVVQNTLHDLELIRAAGVEGLEPVFELLQAALVNSDTTESYQQPARFF